MDYPHHAHLHNYACWTAARAAQRRFAGARTEVVRGVLEESNFPESLQKLYENCPTETAYDEWHDATVAKLKYSFDRKGVVATYGQVAVIAIYLKTVYTTRYPSSALAHVAHAPIDRILLENIRKCANTGPFTGSISWTKFGKAEYYAALKYLRQECKNQPFWSIERYWTT